MVFCPIAGSSAPTFCSRCSRCCQMAWRQADTPRPHPGSRLTSLSCEYSDSPSREVSGRICSYKRTPMQTHGATSDHSCWKRRGEHLTQPTCFALGATVPHSGTLRGGLRKPLNQKTQLRHAIRNDVCQHYRIDRILAGPRLQARVEHPNQNMQIFTNI